MGGGGGGGVLPINQLMGICSWMGLCFHDWIDYYGVAFFNGVTRIGSQIVGILGVRKFWLVGFKNGKICGKKKLLNEELQRC